MVWPFKRRPQSDGGERPPQRIAPPREDKAEVRLIEEVLSWLQQHAPGVDVRPSGDSTQLQIGRAPKGERRSEAGAIIRFKHAKIAGIELYDPALRDTMNTMVKHFDRLQKWSFNGVVSTKYDENHVDATT